MQLNLSDNIVSFSSLSPLNDDQARFDKFYNLYKPYIKSGDYCVDIGANTGDSSLAMYDLCKSDGKIICFEPLPKAFQLLSDNVNNNGLQNNFDLQNYGISEIEGKIDFVSSYVGDNGGILEGFEDTRDGYTLKADFINIEKFLLENYNSNLDKIKFIKIDAEGYDFKILGQLKNILQSIKPTIIIEWWYNISQNDSIFDTIASLGYTAYRSDNLQEAFREQFANKSEDLILISK